MSLRSIDKDIYRDLRVPPPPPKVNPFDIQGLYLRFRDRANPSVLPAIMPGVPTADRQRLVRWDADNHKEWGFDPVGWDLVSVVTVPAAVLGALLAGSWSLLFVLVPVVGLVQVVSSAIPRRLIQRRRIRWSGAMISRRDQRDALAEDDELGVRLLHVSVLVERLRRHDAVTTGMVEVTAEELDEIHYRVVSVLVDAAGLAGALRRARRAAELTNQVRAREGELHAVYATVDTQIAQLKQLLRLADAVCKAAAQAERERVRVQQQTARARALGDQLDDQLTPVARLELPDPVDDELAAKAAQAQAALRQLTQRRSDPGTPEADNTR